MEPDTLEQTYSERPLDINAFLDKAEYLGKYFNGKTLGDKNNYWRKALEDIYPSPYGSSCWLVWLNGTIQGKATTACAGMAYDLYRLMCLRDPQREFKILHADRIEFAIFGASLALANDVWSELRLMFSSSSWFSNLAETLEKKTRKQNTLFPKRIHGSGDPLFPKRIDIIAGSRRSHFFGHNIYEAIIAGGNWESPAGETREIFYTALRRMRIRFMLGDGGVPGKIWLVSPENGDCPAIDQLVDEHRGKPEVRFYQPALADGSSEYQTAVVINPSLTAE